MTKREALRILIEHACQNCAGCGVGIRSIPSFTEIERVREAIQKVWNEAYQYPFHESFFFNNGL